MKCKSHLLLLLSLLSSAFLTSTQLKYTMIVNSSK